MYIEQYIELNYNNNILRGMITSPIDKKEKKDIVIIAHGFTGTRVDSKFIFTTFSRKLKEENIACIRFDFIGSGESDGEFKDMTFLKEREQLQLVLNYTKSLEWVDKIYLLGFSMGGALSASIAKDNTDLDGLILWSPAGNISSLVKELYQQHQILPNGNLDLEGLEMGYELVRELQTIDVYEDIQKYKNKVLIIHGSNDKAVDIKYGEKYHNIYVNSKFIYIENADHVYSSLRWREELFKESIQFIKNNG